MQAKPGNPDDIAKAISQAQYCSQHKKSKELFCTRCVKLMCIVCFVNCGHSADIISDENLKDEVQSGLEELSNSNQKEEEICQQIDKTTEALRDYLKKLEQIYCDEAEKLKAEVRMKSKAFKAPEDFSVDNLDQCIEVYKSIKIAKGEQEKGILLECSLQPDFEKAFPVYEKLIKFNDSHQKESLKFNPDQSQAKGEIIHPTFNPVQLNSNVFIFGENNKSVTHKLDSFHSVFAKEPIPKSCPFSFKVKIQKSTATLIGVAPQSCLGEFHCYNKQGACLLNNNCAAVYKDGTFIATGKNNFKDAVVTVMGDLRTKQITFEVDGVEYYTGTLSSKYVESEDYYPVVNMGYAHEYATFLY